MKKKLVPDRALESEPTIPAKVVKPIIEDMEQAFNALEKGFFAYCKRHHELCQAIFSLKARFLRKTEEGQVYRIPEPEKAVLRPGWVLKGHELTIPHGDFR
jgi:hypothetical protein